MTKTVRLSLQERMRFQAHTGSGHSLILDSNDEALGGANAGMRPTEAVLVALGGCSAMDVISILRKMREDVTSYDVHVSGEQSQEHPHVYRSITVAHTFHGPGLSADNVRRAIELSMTRYCPVHAMLRPSVPISARYEIHGGSGGVVTGELGPVSAP